MGLADDLIDFLAADICISTPPLFCTHASNLIWSHLTPSPMPFSVRFEFQNRVGQHRGGWGFINVIVGVSASPCCPRSPLRKSTKVANSQHLKPSATLVQYLKQSISVRSGESNPQHVDPFQEVNVEKHTSYNMYDVAECHCWSASNALQFC